MYMVCIGIGFPNIIIILYRDLLLGISDRNSN